MAGVLYVVATPIGNLADLTFRARDVLKQVDAIICEDKRVTSKLLERFDIHKQLFSLHQHSKQAELDVFVNKLIKGSVFAYVTDAGTPGLADPGGKLVEQAVKQGITIVPIPGVSALTCAISIAGINLQEFYFFGWPPHKKGRQTFFKRVAASSSPVIFYESTYRIVKTLEVLSEIIPARSLIVARELTKKFETIYRGTATEILKQLQASSTKGEFVVIVNTEGK
ncbi:MAG: 16S rRNA (cytidine(1402)-2'-O)-methyltransferase [Patescibacteria group bacterium]